MRPENQKPKLIRFGVFEIDLAAGEVRKNGRRVKLQEQPFQVLAALLERPGEVVTREELRERLWPADTFVEFDDALNTAARKIRRALGDSADNPRFVETLPRRGYRFLAPLESGDESPSVTGVIADGAQRADVSAPRRRIGWYVAGAAATVVVVGTVLMWQGSFRSSGPEQPAEPMRVVPLTSYPGAERTPSLSPDGKQVAFTWNGPGQDNFDIYLQQIGSQNPPRRLTTHPGHDVCPVWSPDGRLLAFARTSDEASIWGVLTLVGEYEVFVMPAIGGPQRKVAETSFSRIAWLPDGQSLIGSRRRSPEEALGLFVFPLDGAPYRQVTFAPSGSLGDIGPAVSPDGRLVAFHRSLGVGQVPC